MLRLIQFENGLYGLQNTFTGIVLCHRNGKIRTFRTRRFALRRAIKITKQFNRTVHPFLKEK